VGLFSVAFYQFFEPNPLGLLFSWSHLYFFLSPPYRASAPPQVLLFTDPGASFFCAFFSYPSDNFPFSAGLYYVPISFCDSADFLFHPKVVCLMNVVRWPIFGTLGFLFFPALIPFCVGQFCMGRDMLSLPGRDALFTHFPWSHLSFCLTFCGWGLLGNYFVRSASTAVYRVVF